MILTWPLAAHLTQTLPNLGDSLFQAWVLAWDAHALFTAPGRIWNAPIFYPYPDALAFSDSLLPLALITSPFIQLCGAIPVYNLLTLLSFALSGWAIFLLARDTLADAGLPAEAVDWAALVAGAAFAFCAYRMSHVTHLQLLQTYCLPLALWALRRVLRPAAQGGGQLRDALACGVLAGLQAATTLYYAFFTAAALGGYVGVWLAVALWRRVRGGERLPWCQLGLGLLAALCAGLVALPFVLPYSRVYASLGIVRSPRELDNWSAPLGAYLAVPEQNRLYAPLGEAVIGAPEVAFFPGLLVSVLALGAAWLVLARARRLSASGLVDAIFWPTLAFGAFVLSLGTGVRLERNGVPLPIPTPYLFLWAHLPGFGALRVPARWAWLVSMALALAAGLGLAHLLAHRRPAARAMLAGLALLAVLVEQALHPLNLPAAESLQPPAVYRWLGQPEQADRQVVLELPLARTPRGADLQALIVRQWFGQFHWKALPAAYSGAFPFGSSDIFARVQSLPADETLSFLQLIGVDTLVIHRDQLDAEAAQQLIAGLEASPRAHRRADLEGSSVFDLLPDLRLAQLDALASTAGTLYVSDDERIPGVAALALIRRLRSEDVQIYGPARSRYYRALDPLPTGMVPELALLSDAEDPLIYGYRADQRIWQAHGIALYQRAANALASMSLAAPVPGQFHPQFPARLEVALRNGLLHVGEQQLNLTLADYAGPLTIEIDCARLSAGELQIAGARLAVPAGLSRLVLPFDPTTPLLIEGTPEDTAFLRLRVQARVNTDSQAAPQPGTVVSAQVAIRAADLAIQAKVAGANGLLVDVWGAASSDDRPVH
ncbi:MAG: hypothetical protein HGA65_07095, partial [Oscillochloris sp.]|nr:hypothetical protein [Oscillochloris sp.]